MGGTKKYSASSLSDFEITLKSLLVEGEYNKVKVQGYALHCHEDLFAAFVHKNEHDDKWSVSHMETGFKICEGANKPAAVNKFNRMLTDDVTRADVMQRIDQCKRFMKRAKLPLCKK